VQVWSTRLPCMLPAPPPPLISLDTDSFGLNAESNIT
jgi:hypothetical protein